MATLSEQEYKDIDKLTRRIAYSYAMACHGGNEQNQIVETVRFETVVAVMRTLHVITLPTFAKDLMFQTGDELYKLGFRMENGKLVRRNNSIIAEI